MRIKNPVLSEIPEHSHNTGSLFALCGVGYALVAVDTELMKSSREHVQRQNKLYSLTENSIFASTGCTCYTVPLIQEARVHLSESVGQYEDINLRTEKAVEIVGRMTVARNERYPDMNNIVLTLTNGNGHIYVCNSSGDVQTVTGWLSGTGSAYLSETLREFTSNDLKLVEDFITSHFLTLAANKGSEICGDTLHIGLLTAKGIKVIEKTLR